MPFTEKQIEELANYFAKAKLPSSIQLDQGSTIMNVPAFIQSHLNVLRSNTDKPIYEVFYNRLIRLKELISG
jgi:hypothetical protein